jgi:hypothetical protein
MVFQKLNELDNEAIKYLQMLNIEKALKFAEKAVTLRFESFGSSANETISYIRDVLFNFTAGAL